MKSHFTNFPKILLTSLVLGLLAVSVFSTVAQAAGPAFDVFPINYSGAQNTDYPLLDARNSTASGSYSTSQADHDNGVSASAGNTLEFIVYYHNGVADAPENTAKNVKIRATLPTVAGTVLTVSASISADNAATVTSTMRGGDMTVNVAGAAQQLTYVPGSTQWFPNRSTSGQSLPDGITGAGVAIQDIRGCWDFSGFVKFRARVGTAVTENPALQIVKTVAPNSSTSYTKSITSNPSDTVNFRVVTTASGGTVTGVVIRDILPGGLTYINNTTKVNGSLVADSTGFLGSGYAYGSMTSGQSVQIDFQAQVASASFFNNTTQTLTNTANARGDNAATVQDTASVSVTGTVAGSSFELSKSAFNQTQAINAQSVTANAGDVINYKLSYKNTGGVSINNVVIEDDLTDVLLLADVVNTGDGTMSGKTIRFPAISVPAGVTIDKTFQVRVRDVAAGTTDTTMTNIYGNRVDIQVRAPIVKGTFVAPKTGVPENVAAFLSLATTAGFYLWRKRSLKVAASI